MFGSSQPRFRYSATAAWVGENGGEVGVLAETGERGDHILRPDGEPYPDAGAQQLAE